MCGSSARDSESDGRDSTSAVNFFSLALWTCLYGLKKYIIAHYASVGRATRHTVVVVSFCLSVSLSQRFLVAR